MMKSSTCTRKWRFFGAVVVSCGVLPLSLAGCKTLDQVTGGNTAPNVPTAPAVPPVYIEAEQTGCKIWNENPKPNESVVWTGICKDGYGFNFGYVIWKQNGQVVQIYEAQLREGKKVKISGEIRYPQREKKAYEEYLSFDDTLGTITDKRTNLTWRRCALGRKWSPDKLKCEGNETRATWLGMVKLVRGEKYAGFSDWRIPTDEEYKGLIGTKQQSDCNGKLQKFVTYIFPNIYNQYLYGSNHWLSDNSSDLTSPLSADLELKSMGTCAAISEGGLRPIAEQPTLMVRGGTTPEAWTYAVSKLPMAKQVEAKSKADSDKYWSGVNKKVENVMSAISKGASSAESSSSGGKIYKCEYRCTTSGMLFSEATDKFKTSLKASADWEANDKLHKYAKEQCGDIRGNTAFGKQSMWPTDERCEAER